MALQALAAGKHVLVEKPMALNATEAADMIAAARRAGRVLAVYQNWRYMPEVGPIRGLLEAGAIGQPRRIESRVLWLPYRAMGDEPTPFSGDWRTSWNLRRAQGGGALPMFGPHLVDQLLFGLQYRPRRVAATVQDIVGDDDYVQAIFEDAVGVVAEVEINLAAFAGHKDRWLILGTEGVIGNSPLCVRRVDETEPRPVEGAHDPRGAFVTSGERIYGNLRTRCAPRRAAGNPWTCHRPGSETE
jgi:predicted dehydrogenase